MQGCTADFLLGQDTEASSSGAATSGGVTVGTASAGSNSGTSATTSGEATTDASQGTSSGASGESGMVESSTSPGSSESTATEASATSDATTSTTSDTTGDTTGGIGVLDCPSLKNARACEAEAPCDWYDGTCFVDHCNPDAEGACTELGADACGIAPLCTWISEGDGCHYTNCPELLFEPCNASAACQWNGDMDLGECLYAECPACDGLEQGGCLELADVCTWFDAPGICVAD